MQAPEQIPTGIDEVGQELERLLATHFGATRRIRRLRRRRSRYSSSCPILNLELEFDNAEHLSLALKDLTPSSLLEEARKVRPTFLYDPLREIEMYRSVLEPKRFGTAICYGAIVQENTGPYWLFLERVVGPLLWQVGDFEQWKNAARWLARFHTHFSTRAKQQLLAGVVLHDQAHYMQWIERAGRFARQTKSARSRRFTIGIERVAKGYSRVVKYLLELPQTLIHGEFYPSNVIVRRPKTEMQICPIDWEVAGLGPRLIDLGALVSGAWEDDARKSLVTAYRDELACRTGCAPSMPELLESVDYCQLYLSVQWLGWAADWSPPGNHEQDWLCEAIRLSERLGL
jgi:hypothetical protein